MIDEDQEMWDGWNRSLKKAGYKSLIPIEKYFSRDLTEACIMTQFWIDQGVIIKE